MPKMKLDQSDDSIVILCPCGWRHVTGPSKIAALSAGAAHERQQHTGDGGATAKKHRENCARVVR